MPFAHVALRTRVSHIQCALCTCIRVSRSCCFGRLNSARSNAISYRGRSHAHCWHAFRRCPFAAGCLLPHAAVAAPLNLRAPLLHSSSLPARRPPPTASSPLLPPSHPHPTPISHRYKTPSLPSALASLIPRLPPSATSVVRILIT